MKIDVPAFDFRVLDARNASYAFVKRFVAGRAPLVRWTVPVRVRADRAQWMLECCAAVMALPRADVCCLSAYSTCVVYAAGRRVLPTVPVSRYGESEVLLPRLRSRSRYAYTL